MFRTIQRILFLAILAPLCACAKAPQRDRVLNVSGFEDYLHKFEKTSEDEGAAVQVSDLVIQLGDLGNAQELGVCTLSSDKPPTITVNEELWNSLNEDDREELLFHEMGHCVLNRHHDQNVRNDGTPQSMMYPRALGRTYVGDRQYYLHELFHAEG